MDSARFRLSQFEPDDWFVVFHEDSPRWWIRLLACGRFKHVSAFGAVKHAGMWVFYDFNTDRSRVYVVPDDLADDAIAHFTAGAVIVRLAKPLGGETNINLRSGWWCVPAVAHILGLRSCALRPDALFRDVLAHGGEVI